MERFKDDGDDAPISEETKNALAAVDEKFKAKIAERELFLTQQLQSALSKGEMHEAEAVRTQISSEKTRFEEEREFAKDKIRNAK